MTSFLQDVLSDLQKNEVDYSKLLFILPSKRAGVFLKHHLSKSLQVTTFAPEIISIETFIETISDLNYISNTELLFEFYEVYSQITPKEQIESFETFSKWAQLLLQDFNEIDRYLIPPDSIFEYIKDIKELDLWSVGGAPTQSMKTYLAFWKQLKTYYKTFKNHLSNKKKGYQGLVYRNAVDRLENYVATAKGKQHVFIGFNALNRAEEVIIQKLLQQKLVSIYWDIDETFFNNPIHDAGLFMRSHKTNWSYFDKQPFRWITSNYASEKKIEAIGIPKNVGQVKYIGELLDTLQTKQKNLQNTAVILGDESLLMPLLNSISKGVDVLNITMGLPLKSVPLASLFEALFQIHKNGLASFYYKDVIAVLSHQFIKPLFDDGAMNYADFIIAHVQNNNIAFLSHETLSPLSGSKSDLISLIFEPWQHPTRAIQQCLTLILQIKERLTVLKSKNILALEYLYRFIEIFNELSLLNNTYQYIGNISGLLSIYKELLKTETLDFKGEPLQGLQVMGMLESRVLDFETVIISSVNEGILPAGKTTNSFIPFDVKIENGLPTYKEKDAVYSYHFYRLLQRAKSVYILYNTEPDVLKGGEKSRFITQLEIENLHAIKQYVVAPHVPSLQATLKTVKKSEEVMKNLKILAEKGFSPSSLTNYIRNPIDFYNEKILGIKSYDEVEETVAANTLGTVIHETLEDFYKPLKNQFLTELHIETMKASIETVVRKHFKNHYKEGDISKGKNLITFEIAKRYIHNFLNSELETIRAGNQIKIIDLESEFKVPISIPELQFSVYLKGKVDRIDEFNGTLRIIDYKTGMVDQSKVEIVDWKDLTTDYDKYSKSFQVLSYAFMLNETEPITNPIEAGIISFKNLKDDVFLKFTKKDKAGKGADKNQLITQETLDVFEVQLKQLIVEICNQNIDFVEKLIPSGF